MTDVTNEEAALRVSVTKLRELGTRRALSRAMHHVTFALKRAHHATLKMLRPIAARHDLTPARFDLLNILLFRHGHPQILPCGAAIARALGVTRSTICKMVKAMEKAGFVIRCWAPWDERCRRVKLTPYGRRCLLGVLKAIRTHAVDQALRRALSTVRRESRAQHEDFLSELTVRAQRIAIALHDSAQRYFYSFPMTPNLRAIFTFARRPSRGS